MKSQIYSLSNSLSQRFICTALITLSISVVLLASPTGEPLPANTCIMDMGQLSQTSDNTLNGFSLVHKLAFYFNVPVKWAINTSKNKDGVDATCNGFKCQMAPFLAPGNLVLPDVEPLTWDRLLLSCPFRFHAHPAWG